MTGLILCKGKAGLGNRLLAVAGASIYARLTNMPLAVDWHHRSTPVNAFAEHFDYRSFAPIPHPDAALPPTPIIWRGCLDITVDELLLKHYPQDEEADARQPIIRQTRFGYMASPPPGYTLVRWGWDAGLDELRQAFPGKLGNDDFDVLRAIFHQTFKLSAELQSQFDALRAQWIAPGLLGVHVRYSDRKTSLKHILTTIKRMMRAGTYTGIFLATDNKMVEDLFKRTFPDVTTLPKWMPPAGLPIHRTVGGPGFLEIEKSSLQDMYMLSFCDAIVFDSRSTFGLSAALLSHAHKNRLIDLRRESRFDATIDYIKKLVQQWKAN